MGAVSDGCEWWRLPSLNAILQTVTPVLQGVIRAKGSGQPAAPVRPWLYAMTRYKVVDAFRACGRKIGLEGASVADTGQALNMNDGAVRDALHRALKTLAMLRERHVKC